MLDTNSRSIVANRVIDDRLAEVRRAHLLRESRSREDELKVVAAARRGPSVIDRLVNAVTSLVGDRTARPAAAR